MSKCSLHLRKSRHASRARVSALTGTTLDPLPREAALDPALGVVELLGVADFLGVATFLCVLDAVLGVLRPASTDTSL